MSLRSAGDPVLFINNPDGVPVEVRRRMLDSLAEMNRCSSSSWAIRRRGRASRNTRWRSGCRLGAGTDGHQSKEPESTWKMYGEDARNPARSRRAA